MPTSFFECLLLYLNEKYSQSLDSSKNLHHPISHANSKKIEELSAKEEKITQQNNKEMLEKKSNK